MSIFISTREESSPQAPSNLGSQFFSAPKDGQGSAQPNICRELNLQSTLAPDQGCLASGLYLQDLPSDEGGGNDFPGLSVSSLLHALPSGVVILNNQGLVMNSNPEAERLLGKQIVGMSWRDVISQTFEPRVDDGHEVSLKSGLRISLQTRSLNDGVGQLIAINDLTETRKLQTSLSRHQRLSAMGKMMSSLAHQIRTPLSAAVLHADNLVNQHEGEKSVVDRGRKIMSRLHNIERQIRDMLIFARGGATVTGSVNSSELVERMRESATDLLDFYGGDINWTDNSEGAMLNCNIDAVLGAFLNLLENALQANVDSRPINVNVSLQGSDSEYQDYLMTIEVIDHGQGIDGATLKSLEVPFTTTKSNGNGLGLAIVRLVCQSHHGKFNLIPNSTGVTARMQFPVSFTGVQK